MGQFVRLIDNLSNKSKHRLPNSNHLIDFKRGT